MNKDPLSGILLVDKLKGWTSHDVAAKTRSILKTQTGKKVKVGHTGTLDPMATGLMILVVGSYTKRAQDFSKLDKVYDAEITLGQTSTTADAEGELAYASDKRPSDSEVKEVLKSFVGKISQTPPAYSAIKIDGQRAYKLARSGQVPDLKPRQVEIFSISNTEYNYPNLKFRTHVSSGTYIRSLAKDMGQELGTGAYLSSLHRTKVGNYDVRNGLKTEYLKGQEIVNRLQE